MKLTNTILATIAALSLVACAGTQKQDDMASYDTATPEQTVSVEDSAVQDTSSTTTEETPSLGASSSGLGH